MPALFPVLMVGLFRDLRDGDALVQRLGEGEYIVVDDLRPAAVVALGRDDDLAFESLLPRVVVLDLPGDSEHGEEDGAHAVGVADAGERAGEEFELDAVGLEFAGQRPQLSSWTVRMTGVSGAASLNWWASARSFSSSGRTLTRVLILLREDLVALRALEGFFELARQLLAGGGGARVPDADRPLRAGADTTASAGPCFQARPGQPYARSPATSTSAPAT